MPNVSLRGLSGLNTLPTAPRINIVAAALFVLPAAAGIAAHAWLQRTVAEAVAGILLGALLSLSPKVAQQWERAVVLRLGRYIGLRGPGLFWVIPLVDWIAD